MGFFETILGILSDAGFPPIMIALVSGVIAWFVLIHKQIDKIQEDASKFIHRKVLANYVDKDLCTMYKKNNRLETTLVENLNSHRLDSIEEQMKTLIEKVDKIHIYLVRNSKTKKENKNGCE